MALEINAFAEFEKVIQELAVSRSQLVIKVRNAKQGLCWVKPEHLPDYLRPEFNDLMTSIETVGNLRKQAPSLISRIVSLCMRLAVTPKC